MSIQKIKQMRLLFQFLKYLYNIRKRNCGDTTFGGVADLINKTADAIGNLLGKTEKAEGIGYITSGRDLTNIAKPNLRRFSIQSDLEGMENAPELAKGGVLKRGQWGFLEGDGAEAVVPLEKNTGWIRSVAKEISNMIPTYQLSNSVNTNLVPADLTPLVFCGGFK